MGLYDKLTGQGSTLSITGDGSTPNINPLSTKRSKMHADGDAAGYSMTGRSFFVVNTQYQQYVDGAINFLPRPSELDTSGVRPTGPFKDPKTISINNSFDNGEYLKNLPR